MACDKWPCYILSRRANSKVKKDDAKIKLLQKDEHLLSLQEKLEQKKQERLELQQKSKSRPPKSSLGQTRNLIRDKVSVQQIVQWNWQVLTSLSWRKFSDLQLLSTANKIDDTREHGQYIALFYLSSYPPNINVETTLHTTIATLNEIDIYLNVTLLKHCHSMHKIESNYYYFCFLHESENLFKNLSLWCQPSFCTIHLQLS